MRQLTSRLNGLKRICVNADFNTKLMLANGIIISKITYLITVWGGAKQYLLNMLQVQQLAAARLVCGFTCWRWSKRKLLDKVGWLSVRQLIFYHTVLQAHKTLSVGLPRPLFHELSGEYPRNTRSATAGHIRQIGRSKDTFKYRAAQFYNRVPTEVRVGSVATVKLKLKKWIKHNVPVD